MATEARRSSPATPAGAQAALPGVVVERPLYSVGNLPLRAGWVQAIRPPGAKAFMQIRCVVEGGEPAADLTARLLVHLFDPTCTNTPLIFSSVHFRTDNAGHGEATVSIRPEEVPASVRRAEHGFRLEVAHGGSVVYRTDCTATRVDRYET